jgi:hypothetical protein
MLHGVAFVKTDVSEESNASINRVELLTITIYIVGASSQCSSVATYFLLCSHLANSFQPDDGGDTLLRNVGPYKSHTAQGPRTRYSLRECAHIRV